MHKVSFHTFGCKTNVYDTQAIANTIVDMDVVESEIVADIHVVNTCTVTSSSDAQARNLLRRLDKYNTNAKIFITGCYAKRKTEEIIKLIEELNSNNKNNFRLSDEVELGKPDFLRTDINFRTRAFVKIGDGCNNFCSYCIIPFVRGKPWSRQIDDIVSEIKKMESNGVKEVVLTSMCISSYEYGLVNLLNCILSATSTIRIRLSSLRPSKISDELLIVMQNSRICPHLHISLQNGSDRILGLMNRLDYKAKDFIEICNKAKNILADRIPFIAADIIVGFPGETEQDFKQTMDILRKSCIDKLHVFVFSSRPGTVAASIKLEGDGYATGKQIKRFKNELLDFSKDQFNEFMKKMYGKKINVLWETNSNGHSENYCPVKGKGKANTVSSCTVIGADSEFLLV